jgi:hypothetical protein
MNERREYAQRYKKLWHSLANWLRNSSGWKVSGVAKEGSRRRGDFKAKSDLDIDFWISESYNKQTVYDDIIPKLRKNFPGSNVQKGGSQNVLKFAYNGLLAEIILVSKDIFTDKVYRNKYELKI